jgi:hypothetical protein
MRFKDRLHTARAYSSDSRTVRSCPSTRTVGVANSRRAPFDRRRADEHAILGVGREEQIELGAVQHVVFALAFSANFVPHFVSGVLGRTFPTPFASPPFRARFQQVI